MSVARRLLLVGATVVCAAKLAIAADLPRLGQTLTDEQVTAFARLAIQGIEKEYPNKLSHVWTDDDSGRTPRQLHPVFYGCFDWHSSVHGHWMLVRLLKLYPQASVATEIRALLNRQLNADKLRVEAEYFQKKSNRTFERTYGWAWALRLAQELRTWDDPDARDWAKNFSPLETRIVTLTKAYLPRLTYPIRSGVHPDTAFALGLMLDYARAVDDLELSSLAIAYSRAKYYEDREYPARFEPSGQDFFSRALNEADLMRRVMSEEMYTAWFERFLPGLAESDSDAATLLEPAVVSDVTDPKIVHLAGLNLSRAWTQHGVLTALPDGDPRRSVLKRSVAAHTKAGMQYVFSGHYEGEHWLATFAVYLLTDAGNSSR